MKKNSIKRKVVLLLMVIQIPLIVIILTYSFYFINFFNTKISESNKNALRSYCDVVETNLSRYNARLLNFLASDKNFSALVNASEPVIAHLSSLEILNGFQSFISEDDLIYACYIMNQEHDIFREVYGYESDFHRKEVLREYFRNIELEKREIGKGWASLSIGDYSYLYNVSGYNGTYCVYIIDIENIDVPQKNKTAGSHDRIIFYSSDQMLIQDEGLIKSNVRLSDHSEYYFSGHPQQYLIIEQPVQYTDVRAAYVVEYNGFLGSLSIYQIGVMTGAIILIIIMIPLSYHVLKRVFFKPFDQLVYTMNSIRQGDLDSRADESYQENELVEVTNTFNRMIEAMNDLKIRSYEKELALRQTQLDFYQLQIKPHFYINCLKCVYNMIQERDYKSTQKLIIYLSNHLRYVLSEGNAVVKLSKEVDYIENYMKIQSIGMTYPPEFSIEIDNALENLSIPAISLLTLVENCVKYAGYKQMVIKIKLQVSRIVSEDENLINIHISDNGQGFLEQQLQVLNDINLLKLEEKSVGIYNVIQRFMLYYGEKDTWFVFSNLQGAHVDIFIKDGEGK